MTTTTGGPGDRSPLNNVRNAQRAWHRSRRRTAHFKLRRYAAIQAAHDAGLGYGTIAKVANISRSAVQQICGLELDEGGALPDEEDSEGDGAAGEENGGGRTGGNGEHEHDRGEHEGDEPKGKLPTSGGGVDSEQHGDPPFCRHGVRWGRCCRKA